MCDCLQERDDEIAGKVGPETVMIFSKSTSYHLGKDIFELIAPDDTGWMLNCVTQSDSNDTSDSTVKSSASTSSSSESSRTYKSVCPTECDCAGEAEDDGLKLSAVSFCETGRDTKDVVGKKQDIEYTLAIVKPEAVVYRKQIEHIIHTEGFEICQTRWLQLTPEQASEFYDDRFSEMCFPSLVMYMSSGPIVVLVLAKLNAVEEWKLIMGPTTVTEARLYFPDSIRARYGWKGEILKNVVHGSDSHERAEKEIHFFFPDFIIEPLLRDEKAEDFLWETINPVLIEGLTLCCKTKPADPVLWLANWLILNNPNKPKLSEDLALIPVVTLTSNGSVSSICST